MGTPCGRLKKVWDMHGMVSVTRRLRELGRVGDMVRHLRMSVSAVTAGVAAALAAVLASTVGEAAAQPPFGAPAPQPLPGSNVLLTYVSYAMYAGGVVAGMIAFYAIEAHRSGHYSERMKRGIIDLVISVIILTFGWAILTGAL